MANIMIGKVLRVSALVVLLSLLSEYRAQDEFLPHENINTILQQSLLASQSPAGRHKRDIQIITSLSNVGKCSMISLSSLIGTCASLLYRPYRLNNNATNCRSQLPVFGECVNALYDKCLKGSISDAQLDLTKQIFNASISTVAIQKNFCDDGGTGRVFAANVTGLCNSSFAPSYPGCVQPFHAMFDQNKGDPRLCAQYTTTTNCVLKSMENNCNGTAISDSITLARGMMTPKSNPFCSPSQGGGDADAIMGTNGSGAGSISSASFVLLLTVLSVVVAFPSTF